MDNVTFGMNAVRTTRVDSSRIVTPKGGRPGMWPSDPSVVETTPAAQAFASRANHSGGSRLKRAPGGPAFAARANGATGDLTGQESKRSAQRLFDSTASRGASEQA